MRIVFLGRGEFGYRALQRLLETGHEIPLIVTCDHTPEVGGSVELFRELAHRHGIEYHHTNRINTSAWAERLSALGADLTVALLWLYIVHEPIVAASRLGILNYHAGDLPRYRGNACMNWAMLQQEQRIGLTVHLMEPGRLDSGPIVVRDYLTLSPDDTIGDVTSRVYDRGVALVVEAVEKLAEPAFTPEPQDESRALYCYPRLPRDGEIDWTRPAEDICRLIRAVGHPYPGAYTYTRLPQRSESIVKITIRQAHSDSHTIAFLAEPGHVLKLDDERRGVVAGDGRLVVLDEIAVDEEAVDVAEALKSIRVRLGLDLAGEVAALERRLMRLESRLNDREGNR